MRSLPISPGNQRVAIGSRLRAARQAQQLTVDELANTTGLTKGFLSRVERDMTSPSLTTLVTLCEVLSISVGSLFEKSQVKIVRSGKGPQINLGGINTEERLLTPRTEARLQMIRSSIKPEGHGGKQLYSVNAEIDVVHVLAGAITVRFSDEEWDLGVGDTLTFNGHEPHSWHVTGVDGAELIWILAPAPWSMI